MYLVERHADVELERVVLVVVKSEAVIQKQEKVGPLPVEVIDLLVRLYGSSYVVVEGYVAVGLLLDLHLSAGFEPVEVFEFVF